MAAEPGDQGASDAASRGYLRASHAEREQVINTLRTKTGKWLEEESRINDTLLLNDMYGVSARVIGSSVYVSGQVSSEAEQQRVVRIIKSVSNLQVVNFTRVVPGPMF